MDIKWVADSSGYGQPCGFSALESQFDSFSHADAVSRALPNITE